ncbi:hypothetical protein, partial [Candidatus Burkholderia verschuerenii]|uniref:hypothetical protein n=1 Tax=Candidatus Burkholderia verschuerenii TaxID=242163 RepID=UPI000A893C00
GRLDESDSDEDRDERIDLFKELPGHIDESTIRDIRDDNSEMKCDPNPSTPCADNENERQIPTDDPSSILQGVPHISEGFRDYLMALDMSEVDDIACPSNSGREYSSGAELPLQQEDVSSPPIIMPCYSCEIACAPQVKACFGVLASSSLKEKSHEESSCEEIEHEVDSEVQERNGKKKRRVVAQVWIPRGTLEVMKVFNMTKINLGEKFCVPHKAKKRKRRRKAFNPQSGVG